MRKPATIRRARLAQLIADRYESQADYVAQTGENQGETSALLNDESKSFGEKKARTIEAKCNLPTGWLDVDIDAPGGAERAKEMEKLRSEKSGVEVAGSQGRGHNDLQRALLDQAKLLMLYWSADDEGRGNILDKAASEAANAAAIVARTDATRKQS